MKPTRVDLRIDELVLHGLAGVHGPRLGAAVERELARLIAERGVPDAWRDGRNIAADAVVADVVAPTRPVPRDGGHGALGAGIARAVYEGIAGNAGDGGER